MSTDNVFVLISILTIAYLILVVIAAIAVSDAISTSGDWYNDLPWVERIDSPTILAEIMLITHARGSMRGVIIALLIIFWPAYLMITVVYRVIMLFGYIIPATIRGLKQDAKSYSSE